jgi:glycosyltransferase involved in cell wall biosynthesis
LVDPHSMDDIAAAMCRMATDSSLREELRQKGLRRAQSFSWEKTARRTVDLYREIAS